MHTTSRSLAVPAEAGATNDSSDLERVVRPKSARCQEPRHRTDSAPAFAGDAARPPRRRSGAIATLAATLLVLFAAAAPAFAADADSDGLTDDQEDELGTDPNDSDTDNDGLSDWDEYAPHGTDLAATDTDGDSDSDGFEVANSTDPLLWPTGDPDGGTTASLTVVAPTSANHSWTGTTPQDAHGVYVTGQFVTNLATIPIYRGLSIRIDHNAQAGVNGPVGINNYSHIFSTLTPLAGGNVRVTLEKGTAYVFTYNAVSNTFTSPPGCICILVPVSANVYDRYFPTADCSIGNGIHKYRYNNGILEWMEDVHGNRTTFTASGGKIVTITDARGYDTTIDWYSTDRVKSFTTPDNAVWTLEYNEKDQLHRVIGPTTATWTAQGIVSEFRYVNGSTTAAMNGNLSVAYDGRGIAWMRNFYDTSDRLTEQHLGGSTDGYLFDYSSIGSQQTTVTDPVGNERVWKWDSATLAGTELTEKTNRGVRSGEGDYTTTWTNDSDGYRLTTTYPRGNGVKVTLNAQKQPTEIRRKTSMSAADSNTNDIYETLTYEGSTKLYALATRTDALGKVTTYTNNTAGQPTQIDHPTVTNVSPNVTVTEYRSYNADGTLASATDGEGKVTSFTYYTTGLKKMMLWKKKVDDGGLNLVTEFDYEDWGSVKTVKDPIGNTTTYTTERYGNVTKIASPVALGYETKFTYDRALNVTKKEIKNVDYDGTALTSPSWWATNYSYNGMDKVSAVTQDITSSSTRTTNVSYDENYQVTTVQQGSREVRTVYDERGLVYTKTAENGSNDAVTELTYDGNRNTTAVKNPRAKTTTMEYDLFDRSTKSINPLGHYGESVYDKASRTTESKFYEEAGATDVLKAHHKTTFDEMGRAWKQEDLLQGVSDTWYSRTVVFDKRSLVTKSTDRRSYDTEIVYDGARRRLSVEDPLGNLAEWDYDANGNATTITQTEIVPGGGTEAFETTLEYDAINRVKKQTVIDRTNGSNTKVTEWKRDALGVVRKEIDPKGWETTRVRDGLGRITEERRDMGSSAEIVTKSEYDEFDAVTKLTDDNNSDTVYAYDALGRLTTKTYENTKTVSYAYDKNNNVTSITDQNGSVFAQTFDDLDRMTARDITPASGVGGDTDEDFAYDALNRLTEAKDNDSIVQFTYDSLSRILTEVQGDNPLASSGKTTSYTYDAEGNRTKIDYPSGFDANEARDALGRISSITDGSSATVASFDLYGPGLRKKKTTFGNTTTANFSYDGFRRPTEIAHKTSTPTTFASFEYGWDKNDNPTYEARSHQSGKGDVYSYDRANRLINVKTDCDDPAAEVATPGTELYVKKLEYDMDDVFNLTAYKVTPYGGSTTTTSYTTNAMNEYTAIGGTSLSYTDAGSLEDDGTYEYEYDAHQHLIRVILKSNSSTVATYKYDALGLGRRIKKTVGSDVTRYVYAGQQSIEEYDGSGNLARLFVFGERIDDVLMMESPDHADVDGDSNTTETVRLTYHSQLIGSVTHVTAPNQAVVESYLYDPYGKVTMKNAGGSTIGASAIKNPYLYTGRQLDEETGLYYYRARHYSAEMRRFVQRDPLEYIGGMNALSPCTCRPISFRDPLGMKEESYSGNGSSGGGTSATQATHDRAPTVPDKAVKPVPVTGSNPWRQMEAWDRYIDSLGIGVVLSRFDAFEQGEPRNGNGRSAASFRASDLIAREYVDTIETVVYKSTMVATREGGCGARYWKESSFHVIVEFSLRVPDLGGGTAYVPFIFPATPKTAVYSLVVTVHEMRHLKDMDAILNRFRAELQNSLPTCTGNGKSDDWSKAYADAHAQAMACAEEQARKLSRLVSDLMAKYQHYQHVGGNYPYHGWPGTPLGDKGPHFPYGR